MEKQPTKKQIDILMKNGFTYEQISNMPYSEISAKIGEIFGNSANQSIPQQKVSQSGLNAQKTLTVSVPQLITVVHRNERANSYEFGKAGNRVKIYFENAEDLKAKIEELAPILALQDEFQA